MTNKIKEARLRLGISQDELAKKAEISRTVLSQLETGEKTVTTSKTMFKIAQVLNVSVGDIFLP